MRVPTKHPEKAIHPASTQQESKMRRTPKMRLMSRLMPTTNDTLVQWTGVETILQRKANCERQI